MRILWFTWRDRRHPLAGGAETVNEEVARRLAADGHEVTFLVGGFDGARREELVATDDGHAFRVIRVGGTYTVYVAAFVHYLRHLRGWPDLVIDECNTMPFFAGWYVRRPTILLFYMLCRRIWFHQFRQPFSTIGWLAEPVYLRALKRTPVIAGSASTRRDLLRHGFRADDVGVMALGIELPPVPDPPAIAKFPEPTLLSLGAMRSMKRTLDHVAAFELAKRRLPHLKLVIAGDASGPYGERVRRRVERSPHRADIQLLGRVSREEKIALMRRAHLLVMTSVKEGWGLVVTEAASQGTPSVVYDVDGLRDSVRDGETGVVCRDSPDELANAVVDLLTDRERYDRLRRSGWEWSRTLTFERTYSDFVSHAIGLQMADPTMAPVEAVAPSRGERPGAG
jgi:glycosyltransferase involved in cell wall biosynthesis